MYQIFSKRLDFYLSFIALLAFFSFPSYGTTIQIQTNMGNIDVELFDESTPLTVDSFLEGVSSNKLVGSIVHRSVPGFVIQGGAYDINEEEFQFRSIEVNGSIENEPRWSNVRGTLAMTKSGLGDESSSDEWFFNLTDNSESLDAQSGGFTVFGMVTDSTISVLDDISALSIFTFASNLPRVPLINYSNEQAAAGEEVTVENFVRITDVIILSDTMTDETQLSLTENTLLPESLVQQNNDNSAAGALGWWMLMLLALASILRCKKD